MANRNYKRIERVIKSFSKNVEAEGSGSGTEVIANPELVGGESELAGLQVGDNKFKVFTAEDQSQADWNQTDIEAKDFIKNKPEIPDVSDFVTEEEVNAKLEDYELKADAFSGNYDDLENKPTIPDVSNFITESEVNTKLEDYELKSEAFSGDYNDLENKPTIPDAQVQSNWNETDTSSKAYIQNKPTIPDAVVANPTLAGTEPDLTSIQIGNNKYAIPSGGGSGSKYLYRLSLGYPSAVSNAKKKTVNSVEYYIRLTGSLVVISDTEFTTTPGSSLTIIQQFFNFVHNGMSNSTVKIVELTNTVDLYSTTSPYDKTRHLYYALNDMFSDSNISSSTFGFTVVDGIKLIGTQVGYDYVGFTFDSTEIKNFETANVVLLGQI